MKKIVLAADHGGAVLKDQIAAHLTARGFSVIDCGTHDPAVAVDYPDLAVCACEHIANRTADLGILVCGTGIGMSIAANRNPHIRCALCADTFSARMTKLHNDANVLALGARVIGTGLALDIVDTFIDTPFSKEPRHIARVRKL